MYRRLEIVDDELDLIGVRQSANYRMMLERLAGSSDIGAVKTLADVLDPGTLGLRHRVNPDYAQSTPLNRLVDAARPDPAVARHFAELVDRWLANRADVAARDEIHQWLTLWAANDTRLQPLIARRQILRDAGPVSTVLAHISDEALSAMAAGKTKPKKPGAELDAAQKPIGEVTLAVAGPIAKLIRSGR
jgi:hypothetical protein